MILERYYIVSTDWQSSPDDPIFDGILAVPNAVINNNTPSVVYRQVSELSCEQRFCLFLNTVGIGAEMLINDLVSFFFFPNYQKIEGCPEVIVEDDCSEEFNALISSLKTAAKAQGFCQLNVRYCRSAAGKTIYSDDKAKEITDAYRSLLFTPPANAQGFFVKVRQPKDATRVQQLLNDVEVSFRKQEPTLYQLWEQNSQLQARVLELEQRVAAAVREIDGQAAHINVLRSEAQVAHLQNYYNSEYEVLPLWYKRFGHVLKVVMGKRSFRSLFNDNVKKYK